MKSPDCFRRGKEMTEQQKEAVEENALIEAFFAATIEIENNYGIEWNYDLQQPWTKEQADAWEACIPRRTPEHDPIAWAKARGIL